MNGWSGATVMQAVRGPLLLITLGVLLAVDHLGPFPFWRTWPVLIIVFGLLKLMERAVRPDDSNPPHPQGGVS
ncbi:MAG TPA: DUF5668 domain-containing protein [Bryobacteraceae bacterium]|nr:DUF5668 domain-containing protein [Bryobacteraceae bacterium]